MNTVLTLGVSQVFSMGFPTGWNRPGSLAAEAVNYRWSNTSYFEPSFMDDSTSSEAERGKDVWDL